MNHLATNQDIILSVIVPFFQKDGYSSSLNERRLTEFNSYLKSIQNIKYIEFVIISNVINLSDEISEGLEIEVVSVNDDNNLSLAKYRNLGVKRARGTWVLLMDIDLTCSPYIWKEIINKLESQSFHNAFMVFPVLYLKEGLEPRSKDFNKNTVIPNISSNEVMTYAASSSVVALKKSYYLELGGQLEEFKGWGYEDWEFARRLVLNYDLLPLSRNYRRFDHDGYENLSGYNGFKSMFRAYADLSLIQGLYFYHRWHQKDECFRVSQTTHDNKHRFIESSKCYDQKGHFISVINTTENPSAAVLCSTPLINRQIVSEFNIVSFVNSINEIVSEQLNVKYIICGQQLPDNDFHTLKDMGFEIIEPYHLGIDNYVHWFVNRGMSIDSISRLSGNEPLNSVLKINEPVKNVCIVFFRNEETIELLSEQRELLLSLAFLYIDECRFFWLDPSEKVREIGNIVFDNSFENLDNYIDKSDLVIHLNEKMILRSLKLYKPYVLLSNDLSFFSDYKLTTLNQLSDYLLNPYYDNAIVETLLNTYSLVDILTPSHIYDNIYPSKLGVDDYHARYHNLFIDGVVSKQYSWGQYAQMDARTTSQLFANLTKSNFEKVYTWGEHDEHLAWLKLYGIDCKTSKQTYKNDSDNITLDRLKRRYKKFRQTPKRFFLESRIPLFQIIGRYYK